LIFGYFYDQTLSFSVLPRMGAWSPIPLKRKETFMFIETYYDERHMVPAGSREPAIPYPELAGEELRLWQTYLPVATELGNMPFWFYDRTPQPVIKQLQKAQRQHLFDRIEIWSRSGDPMAVGVIDAGRTRYFPIARWGDAELTLEQLRKRLRLEDWLLSLVPVTVILMFLVLTLTLV
jgi:hypothetical protein